MGVLSYDSSKVGAQFGNILLCRNGVKCAQHIKGFQDSTKALISYQRILQLHALMAAQLLATEPERRNLL